MCLLLLVVCLRVCCLCCLDGCGVYVVVGCVVDVVVRGLCLVDAVGGCALTLAWLVS